MSTANSSASIYPCNWAWCRRVFSENSELVHHVVCDHARTSIPVRRRDIPVIRRAEEGTGESFKISDFMITSLTKKSQKSQDSVALSLPSPPASSPSINSPQVHKNDQLRETLPSSSIPLSTESTQEQPSGNTPKFALLSSADEFSSFLAIPNSPTFSSLVNLPNKRTLTFQTAKQPSRTNVTSPLAPSSSSHSSTGSQLSVELQLTQRQNLDEDESSDDDQSGDAIEEDKSSENSVESIPLSDAREQNLYHSGLPWFSSHGNTSLESPDLQDVDMQSSSHHETFPLHFHGPKNTSSILHQASSNAGTVSQLPSPTAPQMQSWYQPVEKTQHFPKKLPIGAGVNNDVICSSPVRSDKHSDSQVRSNGAKNMFRSGTLKISPAPLSKSEDVRMINEGLSDKDQDSDNSFSHNDSSQSFDGYSFPLQTQAPYQSQD